MQNRGIKNRKKGFTLLETLLVVAIITILSGVVFLAASNIARNLRQSELDSKAEIIYTAAQNRFSELRASGRESVYSEVTEGSGFGPVALAAGSAETSSLQYLSSDNAAAKTDILPEGSLDPDLWGNTWYIEYNPHSGSVSGVFYTEQPGSFNYAVQASAMRASKDARLQAGGTVGYYGGNSVDISDSGGFTLDADTNNGEVLSAVFTMSAKPSSLRYRITDSAGNQSAWLDYNKGYAASGDTYTATVELDSLKSASTRFGGRSFIMMTGNRLLPGDITIDVIANAKIEDNTVTKTDTARVNTLFDHVSGGTAYISCCRHLQNLDTASGVSGVTAAVQINRLSFANEGAEGSWYEAYGDKAFTPITNDEIDSYTGLDANGRYVIVGLTASDDANGRAGLFSAFRGSALTGITMTGTRLSGTTVGALAGTVSAGAAISDCRVCLSTDDAKNARTTDASSFPAAFINGTDAGGLVGRTLGSVTITGSFASTVVSGTNAGGLVGSAASGTEISSSYADCYLSGTNVGGLAGASDSSVIVNSCYSAGFASGTAYSAGLVRGGAAITNSYSAVSFTGTGRVYTTAVSGSASGTYYLVSAGTESGTDISGTAKKQFAELGATAMDGFTTADKSANSHPYNLRKGMALTDYSFPRIEGMPHYGDWQADFVSSLVYFEKYGDGSFGWYGANILDTLENRAAVGDGYALAYTSGDAPSSDTVTASYNGASVTSGAKQTVTIDGRGYAVFPLETKSLETGFSDSVFWQKLTIGSSTYYFNPFFAKTVLSGDTGLQKDTELFIRSARQLRGLSGKYGIYYAGSREALASCTFTQETDINYTAYDWAGYSSAAASAAAVQAPIGLSAQTPFTALYNGGCHVITGVSFNVVSGTCVGMFGYNSGRLVNIVAASNYSKNGSNLYFSRGVSLSPSTSVTGSGTKVYMGAIAGYNAGRIYNCAAAGYTADVYSYQGTFSYVGGLVGYNAGTVRKCSADCPSISAETNYANAYVGGFAGFNAGVIAGAYSLDAISGDLPKTGSCIIAGFTAANGGVCSDCYCAAALTASGGAATYAFSPDGGAHSNCRYLYNGTYFYAGSLYPYIFTGDKGVGTSLTVDSLTDSTACGTYYSANNTGTRYPYPKYVTNSTGSAYVHYGDWPEIADLGNYGVFYWEKETSSANAGCHLSYLSDEAKSQNTLCTAHNDGGVIDSYGYGYYYKSTAPVTASFSMNTGSSDSTINDDLGAQLSGYTFTAYTTSDSGLHLYGTSANGAVSVGSRSFTINPFFAASMSLGSAAAPGTDANRYQIRSAQQLQYINWNNASGSASATVNASTPNNAFNYLSYRAGTSATALSSFNYYWNQSHDVGWSDRDTAFTPVGSLYDANISNSSAEANAYVACFNGAYNGGDYVIRNISISSPNQCVGLFGITMHAEIEHVVMYSSRGSVIEANSQGVNWYSIGGLIGFAAQGTGGSSITDCCVSGYKILDSRSSHGYGGAGIGGLAGICNMPLSGCTAVTDIVVNLNYNSSSRNVRVGGLVGTCRNTISDCYSGGSITAGENAVANPSTRLHAGGIAGGMFIKNSGNMATMVGSIDLRPTFINCYSYVRMPSSRFETGTEQAIASKADISDAISITNCYYLDAYKGAASNSNGGVGLTYDQMADKTSSDGLLYRLNHGAYAGGFATVTTATASGEAVPGKYSFPGSDTELEGRDYPFPTILTQNDGGDAVNVHYGSWPKVGIFTDSEVSVDLIAQPSRTLELNIENVSDTSGTVTVSIPDSGKSIAEVSASGTGATRTLTVTGRGIGLTAATVTYTTAAGKAYTTTVRITVTADIIVDSRALGDIYVGGSVGPATITAKDKNDVPLNVTWALSSDDVNGAVISYAPENPPAGTSASVTVTGVGTGSAQITLKATYLKDGIAYSGYGYITARVKTAEVVGLAGTSTENPVYSEATLRGTDGTALTGTLTAANRVYETGAPSDGDNVLFLYGTGSLGTLSGWTVSSITVDGSASYGDHYYVAAGAQTYDQISDTHYKPVTVLSDVVSRTVDISLTMTDGARTVTLTAPYKLPDKASTVHVSFISEGADIGSYDVTWGGKATVPSAARQGYELQGWESGGTTYSSAQVGDMALRSDTTFTAVWKQIGNVQNSNTGAYYTTLAEAVTAASSGDTLTIHGDTTETGTISISKNLTIVPAAGKSPTIKWTSASTNCLRIYSGYTLTLGSGSDSLTLDANGKARVVYVYGTLNMKSGVTLENGSTSDYGGGVYVTSSGGFNMYGGTISDNTAYNGGGVYVGNSSSRRYGIFTMNGGTITGNTASYYGGGVYVSSYGEYNDNGGTVTGNSAKYYDNVY